MEPMRLIIDGKKVPTKKCFEVCNPATGKRVGLAPLASISQLEDAVKAAKKAFKFWSQTSEIKRQKACRQIAEKIAENAEELTRILTREQGKPLNGLGSRWEIGGAQVWAEHTAGLSLPVKVIQDNNEGRIELHRKPLGVVGSITPWNFPVLIAVWHVLPAILAGNTVVMKPSPFAPLATLRLAEIMNEVLPGGVVNCVTGEDKLGARMSKHKDIQKIVFTGSAATGKRVMGCAADSLKRLTLELGGNDAGIVLPDVDPKQIAEGLFWGAFINGGQTCAALKRLYVHEDVHDEVCKELTRFAKSIKIGNGEKEETLIGPIQNRMQYEKVADLVKDAKKNGGRVLLGGQRSKLPKGINKKGNFFPLTIIANMKNGQRLVDEEQFGPVLPIIKFKDVDDAIKKANDNPNGLGGSIWTRDYDNGRQLAKRLECGSVWINKHCAIQPDAPFGGVKSSGLGVEFGEEGLQEYTDIQVVFS